MKLGIKLTKALRIVHKSGYVYQGLNFDSIIIQADKFDDLMAVQLMDFDNASRYQEKKDGSPTSTHVINIQREEIRSDMMNASLEVLDF